MKTFAEAWNQRPVHDPFVFKRECLAWLNNPVTQRFVEAMDRMRTLHLEQIAKAVKTDENMFCHNQNVHKSEVYREMIALCDSLHDTSGGVG